MAYIIIEIPEWMISRNNSSLMQIRGWQPAPYGDWVYRVDPPKPELKQKRHVHIARANETAAKKKQASWNEDGTRHDKGSFNEKTGELNVVRRIAREVLGLPYGTALELLTFPGKRRIQLINELQISTEVIFLRARYRRR